MDTSPSSTQSLPAGTRIEEFVIERVLGAGGFGITYLARDSRLDRQVVIKENLPVQFCFRDPASMTVAPRHSHGDDAENFAWSLENFSKEAAMLASLDHPGIVKVLRSFEAFGTAYFVMPFVEGMALDELVKERARKPYSEDEIRKLLERVLAALGYLHDRGIYHRDIKPGNILITNNGVPVLIDFGSARQKLSERSMTVVESPGYTPFEQLQSRGNVGPWSDLYALGGTLVKLMTGESLPKANDRVFDDPWQTLASRTEDFPAFSISLLESIDCALELHPRDRWQDAGEWLVALTAQQAPPQIAPAAATPSQVRMVVDGLTEPPPRGAADVPSCQTGEEREFDLVEGCKIRMCWIQPGEFLMGSSESEFGHREDETQHRVEITRGFWMGKYPVTHTQWITVMRAHSGNSGKMDIRTRLDPDEYQRHLDKWGHHPVDCVSWHCVCVGKDRKGGFIGELNSNTRGGRRFDLPTEAEWEYACRAGSSNHADKGASLADVQSGRERLEKAAWYCVNSQGSTHPVGTKAANEWGLHDMLGNVWEWCSDIYGVYPDGQVVDPKGAVSGDCRVLRGGSWSADALRCRAACRDYNFLRHENDLTGFRLVLRSRE